MVLDSDQQPAMNLKMQLVPSTEIDRTLEKQLGSWFEAEFGPRADRWAPADYYVLLNGKCVSWQTMGRKGTGSNLDGENRA